MAESWLASAVGSFIILLGNGLLSSCFNKVHSFIYPYDRITINEYQNQHLQRDELYTAAEAYLSSACSSEARWLKAEMRMESNKPVVTIDDGEEITDKFRGTRIWWYTRKRSRSSNIISLYPQNDDIKSYQLVFHKRRRKLVEGEYLTHIFEEGRAAMLRNRQRKLFTNNPSSNWYTYKSSVWSHIAFGHPATFDTLAMDPEKKKAILDDLITFREGKEYYEKIGKPWKRGYLLYGPPGTGKSTMIAAIANFMEYDVYDLELTAVKTNTELRKLYIETTGKSIIVIEDIDCSLDLTNQRKEKKKKKKKDNEEKKKVLPLPGEEEEDSSKLTLSGLLNFIDGLWSASGGERIIIFTTNYPEKLDQALIRRGRMDMHIEMSYCTFEAFKVFAKNYLGIEDHDLFDTIKTLLREVNVAPADVAEGLIPKRSRNNDIGACLKNLIQVIAKKKVDQEAVIEKENFEGESSVQKAFDLEDERSIDGIN